jgi:hypothetical protein
VIEALLHDQTLQFWRGQLPASIVYVNCLRITILDIRITIVLPYSRLLPSVLLLFRSKPSVIYLQFLPFCNYPFCKNSLFLK